jgi:acetyl-CoA acetyltransferase
MCTCVPHAAGAPLHNTTCRAIEAVGLAPRGGGGAYIERHYAQLLGEPENAAASPAQSAQLQRPDVVQHVSQLQQQQQQQQHALHNAQPPQLSTQLGQTAVWPVNTHGGLLGLGAPWEVPALHALIEAVTQLRGEASGRQVPGAARALVYGNGGIFSASAVAILGGTAGSALTKGDGGTDSSTRAGGARL